MDGTYSVTHVRNSEIKQLRPLFFAMLWEIDLMFGMWVYNDKLQIKFTFRSGPMIFGRVMALGLWNFAKYLVVTTFFSLCLECEYIMMSYRSSLHIHVIELLCYNWRFGLITGDFLSTYLMLVFIVYWCFPFVCFSIEPTASHFNIYCLHFCLK